MAYEQERADAKADIEAAGVRGHILRGSTEYPCSFLIVEYTAFERLGSLIQAADQKFMVAALDLGLIPADTDRAVINDARPEYASSVGNYRIIAASPFHPGGVAIYYDLQVRK